MGFALAEECANRGADVLLICGPVQLHTHHPNITRIDIESAQQMFEATITHFPKADAAILCAAVADFTPTQTQTQKIKRKSDLLQVELTPTKDIAAHLGSLKKANQRLVGFALETTDEVANATQKLARKHLDFIVLNSLSDKGAGFQTDTNKISIIDQQQQLSFPLKSKKEVAKDIIHQLCTILP